MVESRIKVVMSKKVVPFAAPQHTCWEYMEDYDGDGPSPLERCEVCMSHVCMHSLQVPVEEPRRMETPMEDTWDVETRRIAEEMILRARDAGMLMEFDQYFGIERPWWFYEELMDKEDDAKAFMDEFRQVKAKQAEFGYWYQDEKLVAKRKQAEEDLRAYRAKLAGIEEVEMPDNARHYIRSVDGRSGKVREAEFEEWLAIPKNKRPIFLEGGKMGPAVAKADVGSVVIKNCPPIVLLCDIRLVLAKFGGVRDVYRPRDRATGKPKPFVFVEMVRNPEAWAAVDYFAKHPFVLDDNTFTTEGAGERKTSVEMAAIAPIVQPIATEVSAEIPTAEIKQTKPIKATGGLFAALADSDSE